MATIDVSVAASGDDGYRRNGTFDSGGTNVLVGERTISGGITANAWFRFTGISGLAGATIVASHITLTGHTTPTGTPDSNFLYAEDAESPTAPTSAADFNGRTRTTNKVSWNPSGVTAGSTHQSPSLNAVIQELADSHDPSAITIIYQNEGGANENKEYSFRTFDHSVAAAAALHIEFTAGGTNYTLSVDPGSFAVTGTAANLEYNRIVSADPGSYAVTGTSASFVLDHLLTADPGAYAVAGTVVTFSYSRVFSADAGSYAVTGTDATLTVAGAGAYDLVVDPGSYVVTGTAASLLLDRLLSADPGAYTVTGTAVSFIYHRVATADPGAYSVSGTDASLYRLITITAESGSYAVTGTDASLEHSRALSVDPGSYAVTGTDATLRLTIVLEAAVGSYAISGTDASFLFDYLLAADPGSYIISGTDAALSYAADITPAVFFRAGRSFSMVAFSHDTDLSRTERGTDLEVILE